MDTHVESDLNNLNKLNNIASQADFLIHEAHDALERMDTTLTLTEAKVALVRHLMVKRHHQAHVQHA